MRAVLLIAANYVREQRWALIVLLVWVVVSAGLISYGHLGVEDALFFVKQQAVYGIAFTAFLSASAIHNDRRSRRILAVLSKGIRRGQYVAGLITGLLLVVGIYCVAIGLCGSVMSAVLGIDSQPLWYLLIFLIAACALTAATGIMFASFLPPLIAIAATALALSVGVACAQLGWSAVLPVFALMNTITQYDPRTGWQPDWSVVAWAILQAVVLWLLASWIFGRRDIALAIE